MCLLAVFLVTIPPTGLPMPVTFLEVLIWVWSAGQLYNEVTTLFQDFHGDLLLYTETKTNKCDVGRKTLQLALPFSCGLTSSMCERFSVQCMRVSSQVMICTLFAVSLTARVVGGTSEALFPRKLMCAMLSLNFLCCAVRFLLMMQIFETTGVMLIITIRIIECDIGTCPKRAGTSLCACLYTRNIHKRQVHFQSLD